MSELQNLKQAFQDVENAAGTSSSQAKQDFEIFSFQSTGGPNGCGTPDHWSYNLIPDYPFEEACNAHDICYGGSRTKESCDDEFLFRMQQIASNLKGSGIFATYFGERLLKGFVRQQATIYHHFVANNAAALTAYCNSTESNSPLCNSNLPTAGGQNMGSQPTILGSTSGGVIIMNCELWRFPDGNGGYYYMDRNCNFTLMQP